MEAHKFWGDTGTPSFGGSRKHSSSTLDCLPIDPRRLFAEAAKGRLPLPEAAQLVRDLLLVPGPVAHRLLSVLEPASTAAGGPLDAAVLCGQLALLGETQTPQDRCSALFRVLEEAAGGVSQMRLVAVLRLMTQGSWAVEWLQSEMSNRGRTSVSMVELLTWSGHQTVLQVLTSHATHLSDQLHQLVVQQKELPPGMDEVPDSSSILPTIRDAVGSLWQLKQDLTSLEQGTAGMLDQGPAATVVATLRLKYSAASAAVDEMMVGELKQLKKKMGSRKLTDKATTTQVKEAVIALQKDMQGKLGKELSHLGNSTQGCMLGIIGKQTATLSQVAELTVPVLVELKQQIASNSDKIYKNTIHRYEVAKSVGDEARIEVQTLRSQVDQLMRHLDVMVGMPPDSLSKTPNSPSLSAHHTELTSLSERHQQVYSQVAQHQAELLQHNSRLEKHEATLAQQVEDNTGRLQRLEATHSAAVQQLEAEQVERDQQLQESIAQLQQTSAEQAAHISKMEEEHSVKLQQLEEEHSSRLKEMAEEHSNQMKQMQEENSSKFEQLEQLMATLKQQAEQQVKHDTTRHTQLEEHMNAAHQQMTESSSSQLKQLQEQCSAQFKQVEESQALQSKQHSDALTSLSQQTDQQVEGAVAQLEASLTALSSKSEEQVSELRLEHNTSFQNQVKANTQAIAEMEAACAAQVSAAREGLVTTDKLEEVIRFTEESVATQQATSSTTTAWHHCGVGVQAVADTRVDELISDLERERAERLNSEQILTSVQAEQTAALGELSHGLGVALQETEVRIGQLEHACSEHEQHLHNMGSDLHTGLVQGGDMNGIVSTISSLSNRLDASISTMRGEVGQLSNKLEEEAAMVEAVMPKVSALERWVNEDASQLMVEECATVIKQLEAYQHSTEESQSQLLESVEMISSRIDEMKQLSADSIGGIHEQIQGLKDVRDEMQELLKGYAPKDLMIQERARLSEHIDAQITGISKTQQDHIDCVHKLVQTSHDSMQFNLNSVTEAALAKCDEAAAANRAAMLEGLEQKAVDLSSQIENFRQSFNKGIEAKVVPIVAQYCVRALAEPTVSFPQGYSATPMATPTSGFAQPPALSSSPWSTDGPLGSQFSMRP